MRFEQGIPWQELPEFVQNAEKISQQKSRLGGSITHVQSDNGAEYFIKLGFGFERLELLREYRNMVDLGGIIPIPKVSYFADLGAGAVLISERFKGRPLHECMVDIESAHVVELAKEVLEALWSAEISPGDLPIAAMEELEDIQELMSHNLLDLACFKKNTGKNPSELMNKALTQIQGHDVNVVSHGDLCLPNILVNEDFDWVLIDWGKGGKGDKSRDLAALEGSFARNNDERLFQELVSSCELTIQESLRAKMDLYTSLDNYWYCASFNAQ